MPSVVVLLMAMMMIIHGGVEVMECLEMDEDESEISDREIRALCNLNPNLNICLEYALEKEKLNQIRSGRQHFGIQGIEPHLNEKRKSAYMRFGKRYVDSNDYVKRKSAYMRFGR